jgi:hypothetical protein
MTEIRVWKERRWRKDPRCAYCGVVTILRWTPPPRREGGGNPRPPLNLATVDHLRDRYDPTRQDPPRHGEVRRVLACWRCNNALGAIRTALQPLEELRRRSSGARKDAVRRAAP